MPKKKPLDDPRWTSDLQPAPGNLRILQAFLNTASPRQTEDPASPGVLADVLQTWGLLTPTAELGDADFELLTQVRSALRSLVVQGSAVSHAALECLDQAMTDALLRVRFRSGGLILVEAAPAGLDGALAALCGILVQARFEGTWPKMRMCVGPTCRAVYYAESGRSKWCSRRCCSRSTSLTYRKRNLEQVRRKDRAEIFYRRFNRGI